MGKDRDLPIEERLKRGAKDHYDKPEVNSQLIINYRFANTSWYQYAHMIYFQIQNVI